MEKQDKIERFKRLNQFVKPGQILFAGSSLMEQFPIYEFLQDFDLPLTIYNRGVGGYTTTELMENMEPCIYALKPALKIRTNARISEANKAVAALAEEFGAMYLDVSAGITDENGNLKEEYTIEGMHMYANGYKPVFDTLLPVLERLV